MEHFTLHSAHSGPPSLPRREWLVSPHGSLGLPVVHVDDIPREARPSLLVYCVLLLFILLRLSSSRELNSSPLLIHLWADISCNSHAEKLNWCNISPRQKQRCQFILIYPITCLDELLYFLWVGSVVPNPKISSISKTFYLIKWKIVIVKLKVSTGQFPVLTVSNFYIKMKR